MAKPSINVLVPEEDEPLSAGSKRSSGQGNSVVQISRPLSATGGHAALQKRRSSADMRHRGSATMGSSSTIGSSGTMGWTSSLPFSTPTGASEMNARSAAETLRHFKFFQEMEIGVQERLPAIVKHVVFPAGCVIFQQGDPPGNCYVILSGQVGIFVNNEEEGADGRRRSSLTNYAPSRLLLTEGHRRERGSADNQEFVANANEHVEVPSPGLGHRKSRPHSPNMPSTPHRRSRPPSANTPGAVHRKSRPPSGANGVRHNSVKNLRHSTINGKLSLPTIEGSMDPQEHPDLIDSALQSSQRRTVEGFSVYNENANLGSHVHNMDAGTLFGELALLEDQPRSATVKCLSTCELLVIARQEFEAVLKSTLAESQLEKLHFLQLHVPGVRESPPAKPGRPHVSYFFRKQSFPKGHEFFTQGCVPDDSIYVICSGEVEFSRVENSTPTSRPVSRGNLARLVPLQRPGSRPGSQGGSRPRSQGGSRPGSRGGSKPRSRNDSRPHKPCDDDLEESPQVKKMGILLSGALFGSLPTSTPEPFTVTVTNGPCQVYSVVGADIRKLPPRLFDHVREYITRSTTWRLERLKMSRSVEPKACFAASMPDLKNWGATRIGNNLLSGGKLHTHKKLEHDLYFEQFSIGTALGPRGPPVIPSCSTNALGPQDSTVRRRRNSLLAH